MTNYEHAPARGFAAAQQDRGRESQPPRKQLRPAERMCLLRALHKHGLLPLRLPELLNYRPVCHGNAHGCTCPRCIPLSAASASALASASSCRRDGMVCGCEQHEAERATAVERQLAVQKPRQPWEAVAPRDRRRVQPDTRQDVEAVARLEDVNYQAGAWVEMVERGLRAARDDNAFIARALLLTDVPSQLSEPAVRHLEQISSRGGDQPPVRIPRC